LADAVTAAAIDTAEEGLRGRSGADGRGGCFQGSVCQGSIGLTAFADEFLARPGHQQMRLSHHYRVDGESERGLFVGVGVDRYSSPDLPDLSGSTNEVQAIGELVGDHFSTCVLCDPDEATVLKELRDRAGYFSGDAGAAVLMWSGHGIPGAGPNTLRLLARDSRKDPSEGFDPGDVATRVAATGANQILVIIDTCYAGNAIDAVALIYNYFRLNPPAGEWCWFGLLAACGNEKIRQHQLGPELERLLRDGPHGDSPHADDIRRRWSIHHRFIRGDDLCDALIKQRDPAAATEAKFTSTGDPRPFIRNPLWSVVAGPLSLAEVLTGVPMVLAFFGRQAEIATVARWLAERHLGVYVVTGAAGSGKSALLHHALSRNTEYDAAATDATAPVIIDVGGLSTEVIAATVDSILVARGLLEPATAPRNAFELCGGLQRRRDRGALVPAIALDALTEAAEPTRVIESLVTPLSTVATVIVATRSTRIRVPRQRRASQSPQLAAAGETVDLLPIAAVLAAADRILDLDSPPQQMSGWSAIEEMLEDPSNAAPGHDPAGAITALRQVAGDESSPPFVLAKLLVENMRGSAAVPEPRRGAVDGPLSVGLDQVVTRAYEGATLQAAVALLNVLPYGLGAGLPEREWLVIANATRPPDSPPLGRDDVAVVLPPVSAYIVEDSESEEAVYRFAHTLIAQHFAANARNPVGDENTLVLQVASALVAALEPVDSSTTSPGSPHLERYLWRYVARAGERGLDLLRGNDLLSKDLAAAALAVSIDAVGRGDIRAALSLAEEATSLADNLAGLDRDRQSAPALAHLATMYQSTGQITKAVQTGRRAVEAYNQLVTQQPEVVIDLAAVALNLANMLMEAQDTTASGVATQAVELEQRFLQLGGDNHYRLGIARNTLALALSLEGRIDEAVHASRDAVDTLEAAVNETGSERDRAALAQALQNLGSHLAQQGELDDAVSVTERARAIMDSLVASDDTWRSALLETLSDLGARYLQVGEAERGLTTTAEAVRGYRSMSSLTPAEAVNYAGALTNYANILIALDRGEAAMDPARAAVEMMREAADQEEAKRTALAMILDNYANALTLTGRHNEALEASEQALAYYRAARDNNPSLDNDMARVLSNYCQRLAVTGRFTEAAAAGADAITLFEQLSTHDPRNEVYAATTLAHVASYTVAAGNTDAGLLLAARAVLQGEQLLVKGVMSHEELAKNYIEATKTTERHPSVAVRYAQRAVQLLQEAGLSGTPEYATALRNLAALHGKAGQIGLGLATIDDAIEVWTQLLALDSSHRHGLASAMGIRARLQLEGRNPGDARDTAIAAIAHYRLLPELSINDIETCGGTFATFAIALGQLGDNEDRLDELLAQCLENRAGPIRALLLYTFVNGLPLEYPRSPSWLHTAIKELGDANPMLLLQIRRLTRKIRDASRVRFDQQWQQSTGTEVPAWATIDQQKIDWTMRWISASDYTASQAFLEQNSHLLGDDYDSAIAEVFLVLDAPRAAGLNDIRARLRFAPSSDPQIPDPRLAVQAIQPGANDTAPTNIYDLAEQFLEANLNQRASLLEEHGEELRGDTVGRHLRARHDNPRATAAVGLIELSRIQLHTDVATAAADADQADAVLARLAEQHDVRVLRQAAAVLTDNAIATTEPDVSVAVSFYLGVALLNTEHSAQGRELIADAAEAAPTRAPQWLRLCERLSASKPEFAEAESILSEEAAGEGG